MMRGELQLLFILFKLGFAESIIRCKPNTINCSANRASFTRCPDTGILEDLNPPTVHFCASSTFCVTSIDLQLPPTTTNSPPTMSTMMVVSQETVSPRRTTFQTHVTPKTTTETTAFGMTVSQEQESASASTATYEKTMLSSMASQENSSDTTATHTMKSSTKASQMSNTIHLQMTSSSSADSQMSSSTTMASQEASSNSITSTFQKTSSAAPTASTTPTFVETTSSATTLYHMVTVISSTFSLYVSTDSPDTSSHITKLFPTTASQTITFGSPEPESTIYEIIEKTTNEPVMETIANEIVEKPTEETTEDVDGNGFEEITEEISDMTGEEEGFVLNYRQQRAVVLQSRQFANQPTAPCLPLNCPGRGIFGAGTISCRVYYFCDRAGGVPSPSECGAGLHFNSNSLQCQEPYLAGCDPRFTNAATSTTQSTTTLIAKRSSTSTKGVEQATTFKPTTLVKCRGQRRIPDPSSCKHYFRCTLGQKRATRVSCPPRQSYDTRTQRCQRNSNCGSSKPRG